MRCLLLLYCLLLNAVQAEISVVTSIRPLYQITAAIMQGIGSPELLIKSEHSTHHFAFRPSHFRMLQKADLVIWIDRHFEAGFQRIAEILPDKTRQLELLSTLGMENQDGHIWYSPKHLYEISNHIAARLGELDAGNQAVYQRNKVTFQQQIDHWRQAVELLLTKNKPRILLEHDFLQHFGEEFELRALAVIHNNHDQHGGIKALQLIEQQLLTHPAKCLISNKAHISSIGKNLTDQFSLSSHSIKSFANEGDIATRFLRHLQHLGRILASC
ncbi:MAG: zinc ABC transporter solute-binding protein [Gammaproteobacteria bacterium]|nr:zinc ABC transporter solute-binding protein [Gammaproteobacteria bacterium]